MRRDIERRCGPVGARAGAYRSDLPFEAPAAVGESIARAAPDVLG